MAEQKQDTGQVNFKEIQTRLDNKLIDPRQLNRAQRGALDLAFKDGKLKGYSSVSEMDAERQYARTAIAKEFKEKLAPLTPTSALSLGIRRGNTSCCRRHTWFFCSLHYGRKKISCRI
jgi:hypothetical protein